MTAKAKTKSFKVRVTDRMKSEVAALAEMRGCDESDIVREAIILYLQRFPKAAPAALERTATGSALLNAADDLPGPIKLRAAIEARNAIPEADPPTDAPTDETV